VCTGIFAKEEVVGTLDTLYQDIAGVNTDEEPLSLIESAQ
jgi:flagellar hook-associated protein FlgK